MYFYIYHIFLRYAVIICTMEETTRKNISRCVSQEGKRVSVISMDFPPLEFKFTIVRSKQVSPMGEIFT